MIISLFGPDSYRRAEKTKELVAAYRTKHQTSDLLAVDLEDAPEDWMTARDFLRQPSMFVDSKLLVVRAAEAVQEKEWAAALHEAARARGTVVILTSDTDPAESFPSLDADGVKRQEFRELEGRLLEIFVAREAAARKIVLEPKAMNFFLAYLGASPSRSARAVSELERMVLAGFRAPVRRAELEKLIPWSAMGELYRDARTMCEAVDPLVRLTALEALLTRGEAAAKFFNIAAYQARGAALEELARYDIAIKSGALEAEEALTNFAADPPVRRGAMPAEVFLPSAI